MKRGFFLFLIGTLIFALTFKFTSIGFLLASLAGIGGLLLFRFIFKFIDNIREGRASKAAANGQDINAILRTGINKVREISNRTRMIKKNDVAMKVKEVCKTGVEIFDYIKKNPQDLNKVRQFHLYYLDATKKIVDQYVELSNRRDQSEDMTQTLDKVEEMLDSIKETFNKQLANLYEDDLLDLNAEIQVLKNTMKLEQ